MSYAFNGSGNGPSGWNKRSRLADSPNLDFHTESNLNHSRNDSNNTRHGIANANVDFNTVS